MPQGKLDYLLCASVAVFWTSARRFQCRLGAVVGSSSKSPMNERYIGRWSNSSRWWAVVPYSHHLAHLAHGKPGSLVVVNTTVLCKAAFAISSVGKHQQRHADWFEHLIEIKSLAEVARNSSLNRLYGRLTNGSSTRRQSLHRTPRAALP